MVGDGAHGIVGDAGGVGAADPGGVGEEGVEAAVAALGIHVSLKFRGLTLEEREWGMGNETYIVEVYVYTTKVVENEVSDCVCALDGLRVVVEGGEEPGIFGCYELA